MKYYFRDRIPAGRMLAAHLKTTAEHTPDHHDYHPHYELYFCKTPFPQEIVSGSASIKIGTPAVVLTAPFAIHAMSPGEKAERFERLVVYFNDDFREAFGERILPQTLFTGGTNCLYPLTDAAALTLAEELPGILNSTRTEAERALSLAGFLIRVSHLCPEEARVRFRQSESYIPHVLKYLYENCGTELTAAEIAAHFHVSRAKLDRDFTASVGQTLHQAVNDLRTANAKRLLETTNLPASEIAAAVGISSEYYFYAFFRRETGMTPQEYRKAFRQGQF